MKCTVASLVSEFGDIPVAGKASFKGHIEEDRRKRRSVVSEVHEYALGLRITWLVYAYEGRSLAIYGQGERASQAHRFGSPTRS